MLGSTGYQARFIGLLNQATGGTLGFTIDGSGYLTTTGQSNGNPISDFLLNANSSDSTVPLWLKDGETSTGFGGAIGETCHAQRIDLADFESLSKKGDLGKIFANSLLFHEMVEAAEIVSLRAAGTDPASFPLVGLSIPTSRPLLRRAAYAHQTAGFAAENAYFAFKGMQTRRTGESRSGRTRTCEYSNYNLTYPVEAVLNPSIIKK